MLANQMDHTRSVDKMKEVLHNPLVDQILEDKLTGEQQSTLKELKDVIYEAERKKHGKK